MDFSELGLRLALPYNFADEYVEEVLTPFGPHTEYVFLALPGSFVSTFRPWSAYGKTNKYRLDLRAYHAKVKRLYEAAQGMGVTLTFVGNNDSVGRGATGLRDVIVDTHDRYPDSTFTLRSLTVATHLKQMDPSIRIAASTMAEIDSPLKAAYWLRHVQPEMMTLAREASRRPALMARLKGMGIKLQLVTTDGCIPQCPFKDDHLAEIRLLDDALECELAPNTPTLGRCFPMAWDLKDDLVFGLSRITMTVLPGHLKHLKGLVDVLKIEGRLMSCEDIRHRVQGFIDAESLVSRELGFEEPPEAWDMIATCDRDCMACGWCSKHLRLLGKSHVGPDRGEAPMSSRRRPRPDRPPK